MLQHRPLHLLLARRLCTCCKVFNLLPSGTMMDAWPLSPCFVPFPKVSVTYTLRDDNSLTTEMEASADAATPLNLAQHSYFNLGGHGSGNILGHQVRAGAGLGHPPRCLWPWRALDPLQLAGFCCQSCPEGSLQRQATKLHLNFVPAACPNLAYSSHCTKRRTTRL